MNRQSGNGILSLRGNPAHGIDRIERLNVRFSGEAITKRYSDWDSELLCRSSTSQDMRYHVFPPVLESDPGRPVDGKSSLTQPYCSIVLIDVNLKACPSVFMCSRDPPPFLLEDHRYSLPSLHLMSVVRICIPDLTT